MKRSKTTAVILISTITVLLFVSCERSATTGRGCWQQPADTAATRTLSIEQVIEEVRAYDPPAELINNAEFDPLVFERLRLEFIRQIEERNCGSVERPVIDASEESGCLPKTGHCTGDISRLVSAAPQGDAGRVTDLTYNPETRTLNWSYVNVGDYDSSGEVGIADITMIAQHYLANTTDGIGDDALETWIDGDKNGEVGVGDITPIAQGYLNEVAGYRVLTSDTEDGEYVTVGEVTGSSEIGVIQATFSSKLPVGALQFVAVVPVDEDGVNGEMSVIVEVLRKWHTEVVDSIHEVGGYSSLALASNGRPFISYYDSWNGYLKFAYFDGSWHTEVVDSGYYVGLCTSIALDSNDHPHISYYDYGNFDLKYAYNNGLSWELSTVDDANRIGTYPSIAIDSNNQPHIAYQDITNFDLKYAYVNESLWIISTIDSDGNSGNSISLDLDSIGRPHISYRAFAEHRFALKYAFFDGSLWNQEIVDSAYGMKYQNTSLMLDSNNRPHISYYDDSSLNLKYAFFNGSDWNITNVDGGENVGLSSSLGLDSHNRPYISYLDNTNNSIKYASNNGSVWIIETIEDIGVMGKYEDEFGISLELDSYNRPHISYCDGENSDLKYAWFG